MAETVWLEKISVNSCLYELFPFRKRSDWTLNASSKRLGCVHWPLVWSPETDVNSSWVLFSWRDVMQRLVLQLLRHARLSLCGQLLTQHHEKIMTFDNQPLGQEHNYTWGLYLYTALPDTLDRKGRGQQPFSPQCDDESFKLRIWFWFCCYSPAQWAAVRQARSQHLLRQGSVTLVSHSRRSPSCV